MSKTTFTLAITIALGAGSIGGWWFGKQSNHATLQTSMSSESERKVMYWYDPMKPDAHFDQPGKSPFMDMDLVPRYADEEALATTGIRIDPSLLQNTGVRYAVTTKGVLNSSLDISGSVVFNERDVSIIQAKTSGIVERAYPLAAGDVVAKGAPLADIRVPEWFGAQSEYLALLSNSMLAEAAKSRLLQLGMDAATIATLQRTGKPLDVVTVFSPTDGMLAEFELRQGMSIATGQTLARINGLSTVWIEAQVPESQVARLHIGAPVKATLAAWPNDAITGKVSSIVPELDNTTRTLRVRIDIPNPDGKFRPGMYARIVLDEAANQVSKLLVPSEAIIATGKRTVVIVATAENRFIPTEVTIGKEVDGRTEILSGLSEGEKVVVSGQFMIDSEASLRGVLARMQATSAHDEHASMQLQQYEGIGVVKAVESAEVTLSHDPIPEIQWPSMTMPFQLTKPGIADALIPGDRVRFSFIQKGDGPVIQSLTKINGATP